MVSKRDWKTWLRATLLIALAAFIALGFTIATHDTAAADTIPCAAPAWMTDDSHIPQDAVDEVCFPARAVSFVDESHFESCLEAPEMAKRELNAASTAPSVSSVYTPIHWEVHQKATGTTEYRGP
jgi:hypothetical protein